MSSISPHFPPLLETMTLLLIISKSVIVVMYQTLNKGIMTLALISDVNIKSTKVDIKEWMDIRNVGSITSR